MAVSLDSKGGGVSGWEETMNSNLTNGTRAEETLRREESSQKKQKRIATDRMYLIIGEFDDGDGINAFGFGADRRRRGARSLVRVTLLLVDLLRMQRVELAVVSDTRRSRSGSRELLVRGDRSAQCTWRRNGSVAAVRHRTGSRTG